MRNQTTKSVTRQRIFQRDEWTCVYCGANAMAANSVTKLHADHIVPFSKGGDNTASNIVTACEGCNLAKRAQELSFPALKALISKVSSRNVIAKIRPDTVVAAVRTKVPQAVYTVRLSKEDADYCRKHGGTVSAFIKAIVTAHKAGVKENRAALSGYRSRKKIAASVAKDRASVEFRKGAIATNLTINPSPEVPLKPYVKRRCLTSARGGVKIGTNVGPALSNMDGGIEIDDLSRPAISSFDPDEYVSE